MSNIKITNLPHQLFPVPGVTDRSLTVSTSVLALNGGGAFDDATSHVLLSFVDNDVRATFDGSDPSASNGHLYNGGTDPFFINIRTANVMNLIRAGGSDSVVHVSEFKMQ